jgi:hypothetical protein
VGYNFTIEFAGFRFPLWFAVLLNASLFTSSGFGIYLSTHKVRDLTKVVWMFIFSWIWIASFFGAILTWRDRTWAHTPHGVQVQSFWRLSWPKVKVATFRTRQNSIHADELHK